MFFPSPIRVCLGGNTDFPNPPKNQALKILTEPESISLYRQMIGLNFESEEFQKNTRQALKPASTLALETIGISYRESTQTGFNL